MLKYKLLKFDYSGNSSKRIEEHNIAYSLLDELLNESGIYEYEIVKNENGKPFLKDNSLYFSISHTEGFCAVCINDTPVGIDCEKIDLNFQPKVEKLSRRYFCENEINLLEKNGFDVFTFFKIWTAKEAIIKKFGYNASYLEKIDTTKEKTEFFIEGDYIITIFK